MPPTVTDGPRLFARAALLSALLLAIAASACGDGGSPGSTPRPIPSPVAFRQEPEGVTLADPAFEALPGAAAHFGRLGGAVYQIEMPDDWNGRLVLYMHGFEELGPEANTGPPDMRRYLIGHGYAWGASSFSSTSSIPGRSAGETAALWDLFVERFGRPEWTYVTGESMGGAASHIAAERYPDRFDGALARCGSAGQSDGAMSLADFIAAGAFVAGVTQGAYDAATELGALITERVLPALEDPAAHERFENIMIDLTGGPRAFDREGFHLEEETNWRRAQLLLSARLAPNSDTVYELGPLSDVPSDTFNRSVIRFTTDDGLLRTFTEGEDTTGEVRVPLLSLYTTGDGQVPIEQARILRRRIDAAGKGGLLVQRVFRDAGHCGFATAELEASFEALVGWVERGEQPAGDDVLLDDLRALRGAFELLPRPGTPEAERVPGAPERVTLRGALSLDGAPLDARFLGAVVQSNGLITPCQLALSHVDDGRYAITVAADAEARGCGAPGAQVYLWTFVDGQRLFSLDAVPWPGEGAPVTFNGRFSPTAPEGVAAETTDFAGEVYTRGGERLPSGAVVEAYIAGTRCGVASVRYTGSFSGFILSVAGPDAVAGCAADGTIDFRIDGRPAIETATNDGGGGGLDLTVD